MEKFAKYYRVIYVIVFLGIISQFFLTSIINTKEKARENKDIDTLMAIKNEYKLALEDEDIKESVLQYINTKECIKICVAHTGKKMKYYDLKKSYCDINEAVEEKIKKYTMSYSLILRNNSSDIWVEISKDLNITVKVLDDNENIVTCQYLDKKFEV